jgi:phage terminase Nu1 subunit (DNA packaging protein)
MSDAAAREFSLLETASICGVDKTAVRAWITQGCPARESYRGKVREWRLNIGQVLRWKEKRAVEAVQGDTSKLDIDEAKRRKTAAEAALAELELAKQRGELVPLQAIAEIVGDAFANVRARLLSLPSALAPQVVHMTAAESRAILESAIDDVLGELSNARIPGAVGAGASFGAGGEGAGEAEAAAEADIEPVGGPLPKVVRRSKRGAGAVAH